MTPKKILLIKLRALGDTVLMTSSVESLRRLLPDAEIHVLVPKAWTSIFENNPHVSRVWEWTAKKQSGRWGNITKCLPKLRKEHFDIAVNFHASPSSAWISRFSGAPVRANHFHGHAEPNRFSTVTIPGKGELKPILVRDLDAIRALGWEIAHPAPTRVYLTHEEKTEAREWIDKQGLPKPLLVLGLGASRPTKVWPVNRYVELALKWIYKKNGSVVLVGSPTERALFKEFENSFQKNAGPEANFILPRLKIRSDMNVRELAALLSQADVFAGNDSGPKHLAVAVGTPTVTVFGPENPFEWHPYDRTKHPLHFIEALNCRTNLSPNGMKWCGIEECTVERHRCMTEITADDVFASCEKLLNS